MESLTESTKPGAEKPVALYSRVSTRGQRLDSQLEPLRAYALRRGAGVLEFADRISGSRPTRKGLDALLAAVRRREVSAVVCTNLDRPGALDAPPLRARRRVPRPRRGPRGPRPGRRYRHAGREAS